MPQNPFGGPQPVGVVYITSMDRPDAALALAGLYGFQGKRESRLGSICVTGSGLQAAIYCDIVGRFYMLGPQRNANQVLPVGLAAVEPLPPDPPMVRAAVDGKYERSIKKLSDTSVAEAVIRNGVIFNAEAVMILSAPATYLAKSLDLLGVPELYKQRVKRLVIVDAGGKQDVPALRKVLAEFPAPIFFSGREVGESVPFPSARLEKDFAWATAHPVVDAYRAFRPMPYDAPAHDLAAAHYAVHPDSGYFQTSEAGSLEVAADGAMKFVPGSGNVKALTVDPAKKAEFIEKLVEVTSAKPVTPQQRFRPPTNANTTAAPAKPPEKPAEKKQNQ
jgi:hypothetical protein